uniref:HMG box domain-containing protein n=1 Tax=Strongyloides papillosus TaxID=174720 RepID=A0A0N5BCD4_STREA
MEEINYPELYEFRDVMYVVLKYSGEEVIDIKEYDNYITKIDNRIEDTKPTTLTSKRFCNLLEEMQSAHSDEDNFLKWYKITKLMDEHGYIYPVPMMNAFPTFDEDVPYQRYYVVVNKATIYDTFFMSSFPCKALPDKSSAKMCAEKFVANYVKSTNEKVYIDPYRRKKNLYSFNMKRNTKIESGGKSSADEISEDAKMPSIARMAKYVSGFREKEQCKKVSEVIQKLWSSEDDLKDHSKVYYQKYRKYQKYGDDLTINDLIKDLKEIENSSSLFNGLNMNDE